MGPAARLAACLFCIVLASRMPLKARAQAAGPPEVFNSEEPFEDPHHLGANPFVPRPVTTVCAAGIAPRNDQYQACEWIGQAQGNAGGAQPCPDCEHRCVLNRELASIQGELIGSTLANTQTHLAAALCPALTLLARYGGTAPPASADLECPTAQELAAVTATQWPPAAAPALRRHPEVIRRINEDLLPSPAALQAYVEQECATYTLKTESQAARVAEWLGVAPAPAAQGNATRFCGDASGTYHYFYLAETRCASSDTLNYNARACIGDDAKWLDRACLYAYLDAAVGSTTNSAKLVERVLPLQEKLLDVFVRCTKISDASECEGAKGNEVNARDVESLTGDGGLKSLFRRYSNIGVASYLGRLDTNLRQSGDPAASTQKGWSDPLEAPWKSPAVEAGLASGAAGRAGLLAAAAVSAAAWALL